MFLALISTIFSSISVIYYKKTLSISNIKSIVFQYYWEIIFFPFIVLALFFKFNFWFFLDYKIIFAFILWNLIYIYFNDITQYLYKNEKISTILPYTKINNLIVVVFSFIFLNSDNSTSLFSFIICLTSIIIATISSIDFKTKTLPTNIIKILTVQILKSIQLMINLFVLKELSSIEFIVINEIVYYIFIFILIVYWKQLFEFKKFKWEILKYRVISSYIWWVSAIISIFLLKEIWIILTTLLWFFWSAISILIAYVFLKEIPNKKDIILWLIMIFLAVIWYYFN